MNRGQLLELHAHLTDDARKLMVVKNRDYGENDDPFRNFRRWGLLGIIVRLGDKLARLETYVERGDLKVVDEQVRDTVLDIINYAVLFEGYNQDANRTGGTGGGTAVEEHSRATDQGLVTGGAHSRAGDAGGNSRGARRGTVAAFQHAEAQSFIESQVRTGTGNRRRRPVDKQHRHATGKGRP